MTKRWIFAALPVAVLGLVIGLFLNVDVLRPLGVSAPPVENLTVERTVLSEMNISVRVRADGSAPVRIAQVQVDGAYWAFAQRPPGPLGRLASAWIDIPYPWVANETHRLRFVTATGQTFDHVIAAATTTPVLSAFRLLAYGLLGLVVGVVPVALGMGFFPFLKTLGPAGFRFLLALTLGLLAFLFVDTVEGALDLAAAAAPGLGGAGLVWLSGAAAFLVLFGLTGRKGGAPEGTRLAGYIALGIGLHNLGEGLAIGAAFASGNAGLGSFLVVGFTLHNLTEGVGIVAPLVRRAPSLAVLAGLAALAGLPAVPGAWAGAFASAPHWSAVLLGLGAGAILEVIVEVGRYVARREGVAGGLLSGPSVAGALAGILVMYGTSLLVSV